MATVTADQASVARAWRILYVTFSVVPIVAGLDKFTNILVDWAGYLPPAVPEMLGIPAATLMMAVGVIEIIAGVIVFVRPRIGGCVVALWLVLIALSLAAQGTFDIAVRDVVMALAAIALVFLSA